MKKQHLQLSEEDHKRLQLLISKGKLKARVYKRAMALLELNRGKTFTSVARTVRVTSQSISTWATKYKEEGLQCLLDKPRSGRPIKFDGAERAKITALACSDAPEGHKRWTLRLLAEKAVELEYCEEISHVHVGNMLKKMN